jgi:Xaa-Pro aminopeptidase
VAIWLKKLFWKSHKSLGRFVRQLLLVKSRRELELLKISARVAGDSFSKIVSEISAGMTEQKIELVMKKILKDAGSEKEPFDFVVGAGPNGYNPHAIPSERVVGLGEPLVLDYGATYRGYCSDLTRTICFGKAPDKLKEIYAIVLEAQESALAGVRPGGTGREIDKLAREVSTGAGYGGSFIHGTGHGIGLEVHEAPAVNTKSDDFLKPGMVITVEPGIYLAGWGGVRVEDMVIVTEKGCETITGAEKKLEIIR